jgi:hypothetical protein
MCPTFWNLVIIPERCTVQYSTVQYSTIQYSTAQYDLQNSETENTNPRNNGKVLSVIYSISPKDKITVSPSHPHDREVKSPG